MERRPERFGAVILMVGVLVFGGASLFHPPTVSPWDPTHALDEGAQPKWTIDHSILLAGIVTLHLGLFLLHNYIMTSQRPRMSPTAFACGIASFTLWVALFVFELTGWRVLVQAAATGFSIPSQIPAPGIAESAAVLAAVAHSVWATTIALGYAAAFLLGLAVLFWSIDGRRGHALPRGTAWLGILVGLVSLITLPLAAYIPRIALWLVVPAAGLMGLWFLCAAWAMWRRTSQPSN